MANKTYRLAVLLLLAVPLLSGCQRDEISLAEKAEQQIARHEYILAEATLTEAIEADPTQDALLLRRGRVRMANEDWEAAEADFSNYVERQPQDMEGYLNLANALERQGREREAEQNRNTARILDPYRDDLQAIHAQLPDPSQDVPYDLDSESSTLSPEAADLAAENSQSEEDAPDGSDLIEGSTNSRSSNRFERDPSVAGFERSNLPFQGDSSVIDDLFARDDNRLDDALEDPSPENELDEELHQGEEEESEPATTTYRWNDYLRRNNLTESGISGRGLLPAPSRPLTTGINSRYQPSSSALPNASGSAFPSAQGTGGALLPRAPLTTGIQSSRGSATSQRPATTLPPRNANPNRPLFERPAPPSTGINSSARP